MPCRENLDNCDMLESAEQTTCCGLTVISSSRSCCSHQLEDLYRYCSLHVHILMENHYKAICNKKSPQSSSLFTIQSCGSIHSPSVAEPSSGSHASDAPSRIRANLRQAAAPKLAAKSRVERLSRTNGRHRGTHLKRPNIFF